MAVDTNRIAGGCLLGGIFAVLRVGAGAVEVVFIFGGGVGGGADEVAFTMADAGGGRWPYSGCCCRARVVGGCGVCVAVVGVRVA